MELVGYFTALLIGISLGLIGAGGSILTVPMMVYLFHVPIVLATSYSLFIVGFTSLLGTAIKFRHGNVRIKTALLFGITSMIFVSIVRRFVVPQIPVELFSINGISIESSMISMVLFSILMILAALSMISKEQHKEVFKVTNHSIFRLFICSAFVGVITGLLGAGGGFLLIPALVMFIGLRMKEAIGTSLLIIALNCLVGFSMDLTHYNIEWKLVLTIAAIACIGIMTGVIFNNKIGGEKLKVCFGVFVMVIGIGIFVKEFLTFIRN